MPILAQEVQNRCLSALDAEGSDRYTFDQDFKFGMRYSQEWLVSAFNRVFAETKFSGEQLKELVKMGIWQANNFSRIAYNPADTGHELWSVIAIYPNPVTHPFRAPVPDPNPVLSKFIPDLSYVSGKASTSRLTMEEWNENQDNVFMPGNKSLVGPLNEYAYLDFANYSSTNYNNPGTYELEIRPGVANKFVGLMYLKQPPTVNAIGDSMLFPESLTNLIVEKTLLWIATKQGDGTNLYGVEEKDVQRLLQLLS